MLHGSKSFSCIAYEVTLLLDELSDGEPAQLAAAGVQGMTRYWPHQVHPGTGFDLAPPGGDCLLWLNY